jgi:hypothetical protein
MREGEATRKMRLHHECKVKARRQRVKVRRHGRRGGAEDTAAYEGEATQKAMRCRRRGGGDCEAAATVNAR